MSESVEAGVQSRICDLLPEGYMALGFVASIKALDETGELQLCHVRSADLPDWEAEGALRSHVRFVVEGTSFSDALDDDGED